MANEINWERMRATAFADAEAPAGWPRDVRPISFNGLTLFGIDGQRQLCWDGRPVEIKKLLRLTTWQRIGAVLVTLSAVAGATVQVWRFILERGW
jgi:hypothetical protein